jgi:hypothetical protein
MTIKMLRWGIALTLMLGTHAISPAAESNSGKQMYL